MATVHRDGATLYYEVRGSGPTVVFAHGMGGNTLIWWQQVAHFARNHQVIVFDHRAFGRSTCPPESFHPREFAADLVAILDDAGVDRAALVCQSMGGWTGLGTAIDYPDRVDALVMCGTPGGLLNDPLRESLGVAGKEIFRRTAAGEDVLPGIVLAEAFCEREPARRLLYEQISGMNPPRDPAMLAVFSESQVEPAELAGYRTPTLFLICEQDGFFSTEGMRECAAQVPGAETYQFDGVGHSSYWEDPERFNRVVGEFLAQHTAAP